MVLEDCYRRRSALQDLPVRISHHLLTQLESEDQATTVCSVCLTLSGFSGLSALHLILVIILLSEQPVVV